MDKIIRFCFVLAFLVCGVVLAVGIAHLGVASIGGALCLAPIAAWGLAMIAVHLPYQRALDYRDADRNWNRAADLVRRAELAERFELRGWPPLVPGVICVTIALAITPLAFRIAAWPAVAFAAVLLLLGGSMLLRNLPHLNAPLLSADAHGFRSGAYGEFGWDEIEGMTLQKFTARGVTIYTLIMLAPGVMQRLNRMHPCMRLLHRLLLKKAQNRLQFRLSMCGEPPQVIELVCVTLWERAVGAKPVWFPDDPRAEREMQALKQRLDEEDRQLTEMMERELARQGLSLPDRFRRDAGSKPDSKSFQDKLARSRPLDNGQTQRAMARIPAYRAAAVVSLLLIGGLLAVAFRHLSSALA